MTDTVKNICVLGGDKRQEYLASELKKKGFSVSVFGLPGGNPSLADALSGADAAVLPFPVSPDCVCLNCPFSEPLRLSRLFSALKDAGVTRVYGGAVSECVSGKAAEHGITVTDYGKFETVAVRNALVTAEGALSIAVKETPKTVHSSVITVFGYGRIGKQLCRMLRALGAEVHCVLRKSADAALAETESVVPHFYRSAADICSRSDLIFNTVPAQVIGREILSAVPKDTPIIDLASSPGGVDRKSAEENGVRVICALSLPGKTAPLSAAKIICDALTEEFGKENQ